VFYGFLALIATTNRAHATTMLKKRFHNHNNNQTNPKTQPKPKMKPNRQPSKELVYTKRLQQQPKRKHNNSELSGTHQYATCSLCKTQIKESNPEHKPKSAL
jgi:hypothetical protein